RGWVARRYAAVTKVLSTAGLSALPAIIVLWMMIPPLRVHAVALDFRLAFSAAARAVLQGISPYPMSTDPTLHHGMAFVYPLAAHHPLEDRAAGRDRGGRHVSRQRGRRRLRPDPALPQGPLDHRPCRVDARLHSLRPARQRRRPARGGSPDRHGGRPGRARRR